MLKVVRYGPADDGGPGNEWDTAMAGVDVTRGRDAGGARLLPSLNGMLLRLPPYNGVVAVGD